MHLKCSKAIKEVVSERECILNLISMSFVCLFVPNIRYLVFESCMYVYENKRKHIIISNAQVQFIFFLIAEKRDH